MAAIKSRFLGKMYRDGEVICRQGELADCMYVIQEGQVEILRRRKEKEFCLAVLEGGDFFGEAALLDQQTRLATARAIGDACVLSIEKRTFFERIHEDASFAMKIIRKMSHRIHALEELLMQTCAETDISLPQRPSGYKGKAAKGDS